MCITALISLVSPLAHRSAEAAGAASVSLAAASQTVDANAPFTELTVSLNAPLEHPQSVGVFDEAGEKVASCDGIGACTQGFTATVLIANNASKVFTAFLTAAPVSARPTTSIDSASVAVANVGWTGSVSVSADQVVVDANRPFAELTVTPSKYLDGPYGLSVYDDAGQLITSCSRYHQCRQGFTGSVIPGNGQTRTYTAYVSTDQPQVGPPTVDVRSAASVTITDVGWTGSVNMTTNRVVVDVNHPFAELTVAPSKYLDGPYGLSIYDDLGQLITACSRYHQCRQGLTASVIPGTNNTRTYTAYISTDQPQTGPPTIDVRSTSSVTISDIGWRGSVAVSSDRAVTDANNPVAYLEVAPGQPVAYPYYLSVYDDLGTRHDVCSGSECTDGFDTPVMPEWGEARTYTAYVSRDLPQTGPPTQDVRAVSSTTIRNLGWSGAVTLTEVDRYSYDWAPGFTYLTLRAQASKPVPSPFYLMVYDDLGQRVGMCWSNPCQVLDAAGGHPDGETRTYTAYVARDNPHVGPPVLNAVTSGAVHSASIGPSRAETSGGSNPSQDCSQRCHADPVNTVTGEYWDSVDDLSVPGPGPHLGLRRSFATTRSSIDGSFGFGWRSSLDMTITVQPGASGGTALSAASQLNVVQENGSIISFGRMPDGTYATADRTFATLTREPDGRFVMVRRQSQTFTFSATGQLTQLRDRNEQTVDLNYDSAGHLARVERPNGQALELTWVGGRITQVADHSGRSVSYGYDSAGNLQSATDATSGTTLYGYDSQHRIRTITRPSGGTTANTYDASNRLIEQVDAQDGVWTFVYGSGQTTITNPAGSVTVERHAKGQVLSETKAAGTAEEATTHFTYTSANQVASVVDPLGRVTTFAYDGDGNRTSTTDPMGRTSTATYDQWGNITSATDPLGNAQNWTYDANGNLAAAEDATGATSTFSMTTSGQVASSTNPLGRTTSFTYDANGYPAAATGPDGAVASTGYDTVGRLASSTDPRGNAVGADPADFTTVYTHDAVGRVLTATDPLGAVTTATYDAAGNLTSSTDPAGAVTLMEYNDAGWLTKVTDDAGAITRFEYDAAGRRVRTIDDTGATSHVAYDALGRPITTTDPLGRTSLSDYDLGGRLTSSTTPAGRVTTYTYDAADQLVSVTDPAGNTAVTTTYDTAGRPVTVTDASGRAVTTTYDAAGRPLTLTRADASVVANAYDAAGNLTAFTDEAGAATTYTIDLAGRVSARTDVAGRTTTYAYDPAGNLAATTRPGGGVIAHTYDQVGRLISTDYSDSTPDVSYTYDTRGNRTTMTDGAGTTTYTYDGLARPTSVTGPSGSVGYGWDDLGRLTTLTYPSGDQVERTYDDAGQLTSLTDWDDRDYDLTYDLDGALAQVDFPNGISTSYDRTSTGQTANITTTLTGVGGGNGLDLLELAYGYDTAGLRTNETTTRTTTGATPSTTSFTAAYEWDQRARLDQVTTTSAETPPAGTNGSISYSPTGTVTALPDGRELAYDNAHQLTAMSTPTPGGGDATPTAYTLDARGNRATSTTTPSPGAPISAQPGLLAHGYDLADQLTTLNITTGTGTSVTTEGYSYSYDGDGLRTTATHTPASNSGTPTPTTQQFAWDILAAIPLLLSDTNDSGAGHQFLYGTGTAPLAQADTSTGQTIYLHTDATGSVRTTTDDTGTVTSTTDYDPYGTPAANSASGTPTASLTRFGYAGEYTDPTGYTYLRHRYYDPTTAQFLTRDPLEDRTRSAYGYTTGNPLQYADPLGLTSVWGDLGAAVRGVGLGISDLGTGIWGSVTDPLAAWEAFQATAATEGYYDAINMHFNPVYAVIDSASRGWDLANKGCITEAARALTGTTFAVAGSVAAAAGAGAGLRAAPARARSTASDLRANPERGSIGPGGAQSMLGANGVQVTSKTLTGRNRQYRIDVENPAPGSRPGQLHLQHGRDKYLYDFEIEQFVGIPPSLARTIARDGDVAVAIDKGRIYLGLQ